MSEKLVIVPKQKNGVQKVLNMVLLVLMCILILFTLFLSPYLFLIPAFLISCLWAWQRFGSKVEYEYTYYDGDLNLAKIINKAKRKNIAAINMEDVLIIAPKGDRSVYQYEQDRNVKVKNVVSGDGKAKVYEVVCKGENGIKCYTFEPDEAMLDAIRVKYPRSVVK